MVYDSDPADLFSWQDGDDGPQFAKDTSISGQFIRQWRPGTMAQEGAPRETANRELRHIISRLSALA